MTSRLSETPHLKKWGSEPSSKIPIVNLCPPQVSAHTYSTHIFTVCSHIRSPTPIPQTTKPPGVPRLTNFHMCFKPRVAHMTCLSFPLGSYLPLPSAVCFYNAARCSELKLFNSLSTSTNSSKSCSWSQHPKRLQLLASGSLETSDSFKVRCDG